MIEKQSTIENLIISRRPSFRTKRPGSGLRWRRCERWKPGNEHRLCALRREMCAAERGLSRLRFWRQKAKARPEFREKLDRLLIAVQRADHKLANCSSTHSVVADGETT